MSADDNGIENNLPERPEQQTPAERPEHVPGEPGEDQHLHLAGVKVTKTWSAPLPPPQLLREFNEAVPGAADVIISEFQEQGRHRRDMERQTTEAHVFSVKAGAIWPTVMDALLILSGFGSIVAGRPFIGGGIIGFVMVAILVIRLFLTPDEGESEEARGSEDSGKDDEEMPT